MASPITYPLSFKAAVLERNHEPLSLQEITFEGPLAAGQVLVRILYSGICGKQVEEIQASRGPDPFLPHMLGHEGSGIVEDIGPGVTKVTPGDHVVLHWMKGSGIDAETPYYTNNGKRVNAGWVTTFNDYGVLSENRVTPISKKANLETACLLGCAATTGVGVIINEANVRPGESVAVFGCGGVGLSAIQGAALVRANPIIAVDKNRKSLELARRFGATHTIDTTTVNATEEVRRITQDQGVSYAIVAVGAPPVIELAAESTAIPGAVYLVGVPPGDAEIKVNAFDIHCRRSFLGSFGGGIVPDRDIPGYMDLDQNGQLRLRDLITKSVTLDQINDGIDALTSGLVGRCTVRMGNDEN
jgi:S-(hydroxymethyl)glutathione dehydrogenase/alcohol dehydrogenase